MRAEFEKFNAEHVGEDSVFPTKNGAPKILEQFKDKPYMKECRLIYKELSGRELGMHAG